MLVFYRLGNGKRCKLAGDIFVATSNFSLETFMPNQVLLNWPCLLILDKTQTRVFLVSGFLVKFLINKNCLNPRTSHDIDMKLEPVSKLDKWITTTSKKIDSHFIAANYDFITIFPIFGQFGAIRNLDSGHKVYNAYIFINRKILFHKNWKKNLKILNKALILFVWVKVQMLVFCKKKKCWHHQNYGVPGTGRYKGIFSEATDVCVVGTKFQVSNITLTSFRLWSIFNPTPSPHCKTNTQIAHTDER